jgi:hypothetical protein
MRRRRLPVFKVRLGVKDKPRHDPVFIFDIEPHQYHPFVPRPELPFDFRTIPVAQKFSEFVRKYLKSLRSHQT